MKKIYIILITSFLSTTCADTHNKIATFYYPRSLAQDAARDLAGWMNYINRDNNGSSVYGALSITPEYNRSFSGEKMARDLFGDNLSSNKCEQLTISGSQVANRGPRDLLADYFYLPSDFQSTVSFSPVIDNFLVDIGWYLGLDAWREGVYFWLHAPLIHTHWDLNIRENVINPGANSYPAGLFVPDVLTRGELLTQFTEFVQGVAIADEDDISFQELKNAKMSGDRLVKTRLGEIRTAIGWSFIRPDYHAGFNGQIAAPTGLRPKGEFLFEPMVGNAHYWELGFGVNGHYTFWNNEEDTRRYSLYVDINVAHLFKTNQTRTFDLQNKPLSRYMLAMEMTSPAVNLLGGGTAPSAQFNNDYLPVANFSTLKCNVSIAVQADIVLMANLTAGNSSFDLGYNFWGHTRENVSVRAVESIDANRYALKGTGQLFGFVQGTTNSVALSATESGATIYAGTTTIDLPQPATTNPVVGPAATLQVAPNSIAQQINTSNPLIFIKQSDLAICGSGCRGLSSKLFAHACYTWNDTKDWHPYIGVGGSAEWAHNSNDDLSCGASQWSLWLKSGVTFD